MHEDARLKGLRQRLRRLQARRAEMSMDTKDEFRRRALRQIDNNIQTTTAEINRLTKRQAS